MTKKIKITIIYLFLAVIVMTIAFLCCDFSQNDVVFAQDKPVVKITKDNAYHIYENGRLMYDMGLDRLETPKLQGEFLTKLNEDYPNGYDLVLGEGFFGIGFQEETGDNSQEFKKTTIIKVNKIDAFLGSIPTNESYSWFYKLKSDKEWTKDTLEKTNKYIFGKDYYEYLVAGDYIVKCNAKYRLYFGGETIDCTLESNEFQVIITQTDDYQINKLSEYVVNYRVMDGANARQIKLSEINFGPGSTFNNNEGKWALSDETDPNALVVKGYQNIKLLFTPYNTSYRPRIEEISLKGVEQRLDVICEDMEVMYGDDYILKYNNVYGLMKGDSVDALGIKLFLVDNKGNRIAESEIQPGKTYEISGSIDVDRYNVVFQTQKSYNEEYFPKRAKISFLMDNLSVEIQGLGTIVVKKDDGYILGENIEARDLAKQVPSSIIRDEYKLHSVKGIYFTQTIWDNVNGGYKNIRIASGGVKVNYSNLNKDIKYIAYKDKNGWHEVDVIDGKCDFQATDLDAIAFFKTSEGSLNWVSILFTVLLGLNLGIMIVLLVYKFGRKRQ